MLLFCLLPLLIEPHWNVNGMGKTTSFKYLPAFNRTTLECK